MDNAKHTDEMARFEREYPAEVLALQAAWRTDHITREAFEKRGLGVTDFVRSGLIDQGKRLP
jgi:hypothetical protein